MNTREAIEMLVAVFSQDVPRLTILLKGPPGCGKNASIGVAADRVSKEMRAMCLTSCENVDFRGLPDTSGNKTIWKSPLPKEGQGILVLDEIGSAPPDVQVAAHHVVRREKGSDIGVGDGWHVVCTSNRGNDRALQRLLSGPLRNRLDEISIEPNVGIYISDVAMPKRMDSSIIGCLRWRPQLFFVDEIPAEGGFPSARAWESANEVLRLGVSASIEAEMLRGILGAGVQTEFSAYLKNVRSLPDVMRIIKNQKKEEIPSSPSLMYALASALAQYTCESKKGAMEYVARMPAEFGVLYIRDVGDHYEIREDECVRKWIGDHINLFQSEEL